MIEEVQSLIKNLRQQSETYRNEGQRKITEGQKLIEAGNKDLAISNTIDRMLEVYEKANQDTVNGAVKQYAVGGNGKAKPVLKKTFHEIIHEILEDGRPRTTKELIQAYRQKTDKEYSLKDMSSKLAVTAKNEKSKIKNVKIPEMPINTRYWWCKADWIVGENLKEEYRKKITGRELAELFAE